MLRNKVERIRAKVVSILYIVFKAIQNQGGVREGGPSSKKRYSGYISGKGNIALSQIATSDVNNKQGVGQRLRLALSLVFPTTLLSAK